MRNLPDHPSIEHVRRQAKDQLAAGFGLGAVSAPMTRVEHQWVGETWDLRTADGRWIVTALADFLDPAQIEAESQLVTAAIAAGVIAPAPVPTTDGPFVLRLDDGNWRVHHWMQLGPPLPQPPDPVAAAEGGRILARLHGLDLAPPQPVVPWLTSRPCAATWQSVVDAAHAAAKPWAGGLADAVPGFLALDAVLDRRDPNPRAILSKAWHAPAAVRSAGRDRYAAVAWEHSSATPKDWELGSSLMAWSETVEDDFEPTAARAFLAGYRDLADPVELTPAIFTSGITAALNWTISRANIALHADDPADAAEAERNIAVLARNPLTLGRIERLVAALG